MTKQTNIYVCVYEYIYISEGKGWMIKPMTVWTVLQYWTHLRPIIKHGTLHRGGRPEEGECRASQSIVRAADCASTRRGCLEQVPSEQRYGRGALHFGSLVGSLQEGITLVIRCQPKIEPSLETYPYGGYAFILAVGSYNTKTMHRVTACPSTTNVVC